MIEIERRQTWFYDVTRLCRQAQYHSGISRFGRKILQQLFELERHSEQQLQVTPVISRPDIIEGDLGLKTFIDEFGQVPLSPAAYERAVGTASDQNRKCIYFSPYEEIPDFARLRGVLPAVTIHDLFHIERLDLYGYEFSNPHTERLRASLRDRDYIFTVSEFTRARVLQHFGHAPERVCSVHLAPDETFRRRSDEEVARTLNKFGVSGRYFVMMAQFDPRKNLGTTVEAVAQALRGAAAGQVTCIVIASAINWERTRQLVEDVAPSDTNLKVIIDVSDEDLAALYSGSEFFAFPSLAEGFGLPIVEAMACGCPILTSATTAMPEVAGDSALYVDPTRPEQVEQALSTMISSASLRTVLRQRATERARRFRWERTAQEIVGSMQFNLAGQPVVFTPDVLEESPQQDPENEVSVVEPNRAIRGKIEPSEQVEVASHPKVTASTFNFRDEETHGTHGVEFLFPTQDAGGCYRMLIPVRPDAKRAFSIFLYSSSSRRMNNNEVVLIYDVEERDFTKLTCTHQQEIVAHNVYASEDGWLLFSIEFNLRFPQESGLTLLLFPRRSGKGATSYHGVPSETFQFGSATCVATNSKDDLKAALDDRTEDDEQISSDLPPSHS